jgi:hypothetical protein
MKGFNNCLNCGIETKNKKYCGDNCKHQYYYNNKEGVKEKKIKDILSKRNSMFYVYGFYYKKTNKPFYIGKGCGNRYLVLGGRSKLFNDIIKNNDYYSKIIYNNLSEKKAFEIENKLINEIDGLINVNGKVIIEKRKCPLCKRSDVEFYESSAARRCKSCVKIINEDKKIKKEKERIKSLIDFMKNNDSSIISLYNLIYNK